MHLRKIFAFTIAMFAAVGCGSDSSAPVASGIVGTYTALQWTTMGTSGQTDQISIGSTIQITLAADGSTSGQMHTAASNGAPAANFNLAGTWNASNNTVDFTQASDNFLRDMTFLAEQVATDTWDLVGDDTFSGVAVHLRLRRTP